MNMNTRLSSDLILYLAPVIGALSGFAVTYITQNWLPGLIISVAVAAAAYLVLFRVMRFYQGG